MSEAALLMKVEEEGEALVSASALATAAEEHEVVIVETSHFFALLISLCVLGLLFVIGIGTNTILLWAFYRRPKLRTISNR